jgi:hypothetical protein
MIQTNGRCLSENTACCQHLTPPSDRSYSPVADHCAQDEEARIWSECGQSQCTEMDS